MASKLLLDLEDDSDQIGVDGVSHDVLTINKQFANHYKKSRRSEELMKLKARYGDIKSDDIPGESTDSESEDEDAEELTPAVEQKWLKTLAALKSNDPKIYDETEMFFDDSSDEPTVASTSKVKSSKKKKLTLKDMDRKVIMERGGKYIDNSSDSEQEEEEGRKAHGKGYYEEQAEIKESIKKAQEELSSSEDESDLLTVKVKTAAEKELEEEEYRKFIKGQKANVDNKSEKALSGLRDYWNREDISEADKFLKDYILEKKYLIDEPVPNASDSEDSGSDQQQFQLLSEDEDEVKKADQFELKYNFRFEEPDTDFIKSYPRTINTTMRTEKNKRKEKRAKLQEMKAKEKQTRKEELNRLKNLKKQEIEDKLQHLKAKSGAESMPFTGEELEEDFDPDEHDRKMKEMFPEDEDNDDENFSKPTFEYDPEIDDGEDWDHYQVGSSIPDKGAQDNVDPEEYWDPEDPNFVMDADYDPNAATLEDRNFGLDGRSKRNKRKKNRLRKALEKKKPLFNPDDKTFEQYLDEYYSLEFEDMVGDLKCRFPYREVPANDFGLTVGEILSAPDKELNSWSSLKKTVQYRSNDEEYKDVFKFKRKSHDVMKKQRLIPTLFEVPENDEISNGADQKIDTGAGKKSKIKRFEEDETEETADQVPATHTSHKTSQSKKRKSKWKEQPNFKSQAEQSSRGMSFKRMEAYGMHSEVKRVKKLRARDNKRQ